jgi:hypothetical protein
MPTPQHKVWSPDDPGTAEQFFHTAQISSTLTHRKQARRFLLKLLEEKQFQLAVFVARKFFFNSVILVEDLNFVMTSVRLALENGHADAITN